MGNMLEDETTSFPDPDALMYQALLDRILEILCSPFAMTACTARAIKSTIGALSWEVRVYLFSKTVYDLEHRSEESLNIPAGNGSISHGHMDIL